MRMYDTIVIGAGSMGLAAGYYLSRRGQKVLLLDQHEPPHAFGSHHGSSRLLRVAYAEGPSYVPLALRARELWLALESEARDREGQTSQSLFADLGVVSVLHPASPGIAEIEASVRQYHLPFERLSAAEALVRWPGLSIPDDYTVHFDPQGGVLFSESCLRAFKAACLERGVDTRFSGTLERLKATTSTVDVTWGDETFSASNLLLSAGAGTPGVLSHWFPDWRLPLQPIRKVFAWFECEQGRKQQYNAAEFPGFCVETPDAWYYGFPDFGDGLKVGRHDGGAPCSPDDIDRTFHPEGEDAKDLEAFLSHYLPGASGPCIDGRVCMYTMTPDEHFVIDAHPMYSHIHIAAGFSGHGFKFASAVGEALAERIAAGTSTLDLSLFSAGRFTR